MTSVFKVVGALVLVLAGAALIFGGFEWAAYQQTIEDREVTTDGDVLDTDVRQLPDGNWTYDIDYDYTFDQEAEITAQGLEDIYLDAGKEMVGEQRYTQTESGGTYDSRSDAESAMEDKFNPDGGVTVYVDPFYPDEGSLSDATSLAPRALQYGGSVVLLLGLVGLARMARRVSS